MPKESVAKVVRQKMEELAPPPEATGPMSVAVKLAADFKGLSDEDKRSFLEQLSKSLPLPEGVTSGLPLKLEYIDGGER